MDERGRSFGMLLSAPVNGCEASYACGVVDGGRLWPAYPVIYAECGVGARCAGILWG